MRATDRNKGRTTREVAPEEVAVTLADICAAAHPRDEPTGAARILIPSDTAAPRVVPCR